MQDWDRCSGWIEGALDHAKNVYSLSDVEFLVRTGGAQFWPGRRAALVTQVQIYPRDRWLLLWLAGGDLNELRDELRPVAEAWGQSEGCTKSVIMGRSGWVRALSAEDYKPFAVVIGKDLSP